MLMLVLETIRSEKRLQASEMLVPAATSMPALKFLSHPACHTLMVKPKLLVGYEVFWYYQGNKQLARIREDT